MLIFTVFPHGKWNSMLVEARCTLWCREGCTSSLCVHSPLCAVPAGLIPMCCNCVPRYIQLNRQTAVMMGQDPQVPCLLLHLCQVRYILLCSSFTEMSFYCNRHSQRCHFSVFCHSEVILVYFVIPLIVR